MTTANELRAGLTSVAKRSVGIMAACSNEESTKLYLALPFLGLLGYDYTNPYEVYPEHTADPRGGQAEKVDFAVLRDGVPVIAVEAKKVGTDLAPHRGQLSSYFNALQPVKLGILTNGVIYEFFVDSEEPNLMDLEPFLTLDLETLARTGASDEAIEALLSLTKAHYDPETVAETAHIQLIKKRLRTIFVDEAKAPSEELCRLALQRAGLKNVRKAAIERHYAPLVKLAFEESLVLPVLQKLRSEPSADGTRTAMPLGQIAQTFGQRIATTERELSIFGYVRRRLAYLVDDQHHFDAIDSVGYKDYVGKLVLFYDKERKGRLFDYIEGQDGYDKFVFPDPIGEIVTNTLTDIDNALKAIFISRLREMGGVSAQPRFARTA